MAKSRNVSSGYTEDWLPVKGIQNNMIITTQNYKVTEAGNDIISAAKYVRSGSTNKLSSVFR